MGSVSGVRQYLEVCRAGGHQWLGVPLELALWFSFNFFEVQKVKYKKSQSFAGSQCTFPD